MKSRPRPSRNRAVAGIASSRDVGSGRPSPITRSCGSPLAEWFISDAVHQPPDWYSLYARTPRVGAPSASARI
ncbi:hypothetical protein CLM85_21245 [Streptomyces albidoflavus]|nr:hypothetical protein CLM81_26960 [Streptomyces albidoflavus]PAX90379.1 hypothetical protein CLM82_15680 [Streptomyces albidoflavus]PBO19646.1 hypothetical protein CLM83_05235 [Streptomyces albidoflavus]PBO22556.1 hypothetical protein CLM85_21245 [Streptomyces albidoflavus]PBO30731.1 hypothetical protein CLM84_06760 [Streptomyces albidoflavus]